MATKMMFPSACDPARPGASHLTPVPAVPPDRESDRWDDGQLAAALRERGAHHLATARKIRASRRGQPEAAALDNGSPGRHPDVAQPDSFGGALSVTVHPFRWRRQ